MSFGSVGVARLVCAFLLNFVPCVERRRTTKAYQKAEVCARGSRDKAAGDLDSAHAPQFVVSSVAHKDEIRIEINTHKSYVAMPPTYML